MFKIFFAGFGYTVNPFEANSPTANEEPSTTFTTELIVGLLIVSTIPDGHLMII